MQNTIDYEHDFSKSCDNKIQIIDISFQDLHVNLCYTVRE